MVPSAAQRRALDQHAAAEMQFDLDAVMATVDDDCAYEWQPMGLGLRGHQECRRMYAAFLPRWQELIRTRDLRSEFWSDEGRSQEQVAFLQGPSGEVERHDFVVVVLLGQNGVRGERTNSSPDFARLTLGGYYDQLQPV